MNPTKALHDIGQSLWLDNITRNLVNSGTLQRYIDEFSVTGLTSNPTIFDHAIKNSADYDSDISRGVSSTKLPEDLFFELALGDLTRAADLFRPIFDRTDGVDGWVSLEVSPVLVHDTNRTLASARNLHQRGEKPNLFIRFQVTQKDCPRLRRRSSLVFLSTSHCCSRENSMLRRLKPICAGWSGASRPGLTRRFPRLPRSLSAAGMSRSVDWDVAISGKVPGELANRLGIAVAQRTYNAYLALL